MSLKKFRGRFRRARALKRRLATMPFPAPDWFGRGYWHVKIPCHQALLDGPGVRQSFRRQVVQGLLDAAARLNRDPGLRAGDRVLLIVTLPELWQSDLTVFRGDDYYTRFFNRCSDFQRWEALSADRSLINEWQLDARELAEYGVQQTIVDEEWSRQSEVWFFGAVPTSNEG